MTGRPTDYRPEYAEQAQKLCALGATDVDLADFFGVHIRTIANWKGAHEAFLQATRVGKEAADERVVSSLYHRAVGYTHDAVKIFNHQGQIVEAPYREHVAPDTQAAMFWLKNRRPAEWRDLKAMELTGKDGGAVEVSVTETPRDIAKALLGALKAGEQ